MANMGDRIKQLRLEKNMTQDELGQVLNVKKQTIMKYEQGIVKNMKRDKIQKLSDLFNVTPSYVLGYTDKRSPLNNTEKELVSLYNKMSIRQQVSLLNYAYDLLEEKEQ